MDPPNPHHLHHPLPLRTPHLVQRHREPPIQRRKGRLARAPSQPRHGRADALRRPARQRPGRLRGPDSRWRLTQEGGYELEAVDG